MENEDLLRLYYGNALTDAPVSYRQENLEARATIERSLEHVEVLRYKGITAEGIRDPGLVFDCDIVKGVGQCDLFVGNFTISSTGLGAEFVEMVRVYKKSALILHHQSVRLSSLVCGYAARFPELVTIRSFSSLRDEIVGLVKEKIRTTPRLHFIAMHGRSGRTYVAS